MSSNKPLPSSKKITFPKRVRLLIYKKCGLYYYDFINIY